MKITFSIIDEENFFMVETATFAASFFERIFRVKPEALVVASHFVANFYTAAQRNLSPERQLGIYVYKSYSSKIL